MCPDARLRGCHEGTYAYRASTGLDAITVHIHSSYVADLYRTCAEPLLERISMGGAERGFESGRSRLVVPA